MTHTHSGQVRFVLAESTEVTSDIAEELLRAADQYMLDGLKHLCEESISQGLTMDNLTDTYDLSENFNAPQLGRRCALFALEHYVVSAACIICLEILKLPWTFPLLCLHMHTSPRKAIKCAYI